MQHWQKLNDDTWSWRDWLVTTDLACDTYSARHVSGRVIGPFLHPRQAQQAAETCEVRGERVEGGAL